MYTINHYNTMYICIYIYTYYNSGAASVLQDVQSVCLEDDLDVSRAVWRLADKHYGEQVAVKVT